LINYKGGMILFCLLMFCSCMMGAERFVFSTIWIPQSEFAGYYVAKEKGFYNDVGLDVVIQHPSLTSTVYHRLDTHECDAGVFSLMSAIDIVAKGTPIVNIFQTSMNSSYMIVSRWGKDPTKEKGKRIAVYHSEPNYLAYIFDKEKNLNYEWVSFTGNINLFISGGIDMMSVVSYNEYLLLQQACFNMPQGSVYRFKDHGYNIQENGVYVKREYYETHRDQTRRFAEASRKGWEWAASHPDEALDIVMKYVREAHVQTNRVIQKLMLEEILRLQIDPDSGRREYRVRPEMVMKASRLMTNHGMITREVTYAELMGYKQQNTNKKP